MKRHLFNIVPFFWFSWIAFCQSPSHDTSYVKTPETVVFENVPPIPASVAEATSRYDQSRSAQFLSWSPRDRQMIVTTRFADVNEVHLVHRAGGAREQLTFFPEPVRQATFDPTTDQSFIFAKDVGGNERYQLYRFDIPTGDSTLLTDGKSRNTNPLFEHHGSRLAYTSTRRNNKDTDLYLMDVHRPETDHMVNELTGGGIWMPTDFSRDGNQLLLVHGVSINQTSLYVVNLSNGEKHQITPEQSGSQEVFYGPTKFSKDGKGIYVVTDRDSDFHRLAYFDLATMTPHYLTTRIPWDVEEFALSEDGKTIAFVANENGLSKLYLLNTATNRFRPIQNIPTGVIQNVQFHPNGTDLGFSITSAQSPLDAYSVDVRSLKIERWTVSEIGGLNPAKFRQPELVSWKSFDGRIITGLLDTPDPTKFPGKRPVIVNIHGGPEDQARPYFMGGNNYILNELGVAMIFPNVRGSTGYGKEFTKLDNSTHRDDTYKDVGALLDWISTRPGLDGSRIMVTGGSYGGYMTWATAAYYNDKIRCAMPVVGISNLVTFLEHTEAYRRDLRRAEYGDERDPAIRAYLEKIAPMNHVDSMHKPIFAVVGKNDPRVPSSESRQILDKLNAQGTTNWFMMAADEGHGYSKKQNQQLLFDAEVLFIRKFLLDQ